MAETSGLYVQFLINSLPLSPNMFIVIYLFKVTVCIPTGSHPTYVSLQGGTLCIPIVGHPMYSYRGITLCIGFFRIITIRVGWK